MYKNNKQKKIWPFRRFELESVHIKSVACATEPRQRNLAARKLGSVFTSRILYETRALAARAKQHRSFLFDARAWNGRVR